MDVLPPGGIFFCPFKTVVYNTWTKRVGDLDYESINFCPKVRYTIVTAAAHPERKRKPQPGGP